MPSIEDYLSIDDYVYAVNQTYSVKLREEGYTSITKEQIQAKQHHGIVESLEAIWQDHKDSGWGSFDREEIARYICEKIAFEETEFLSDKTKDNFRSLYRMIAERVLQHKNTTKIEKPTLNYRGDNAPGV